MTIEIPSSVINSFNEGIDAIITAFGVPCKLYYAPKVTSCPNCYVDPNSQLSSHRYKADGPIPFTNGSLCPYCNGQGNIQEPSTETISLCVYWTSKEFKKIAQVQFDIPEGAILTKGYMTDFPKIQRAIEIQVNTTIEGIIDYRYVRYKEGIPSGFLGNRYILQFWNRK